MSPLDTAMSDEDDLPVLTQVLVTAGGRAPSGDAIRAADADAGVDATQDEIEQQRLLVIGNDPAVDTFAADPVADPRRPTLRDLFSPTAPDGDEHGVDGGMRRGDAGPVTDPRHPWFMDEPHIDRHAIGRQADEAFSTTPPSVATSFSDRPLLLEDGSLAGAIRDDVLEQLAARIDTELDARIAQTIRTELDGALGHLQARLRSELSGALRDVVGRAVEEAMARRLRGDSGIH